jgi:hypothetical protein
MTRVAGNDEARRTGAGSVVDHQAVVEAMMVHAEIAGHVLQGHGHRWDSTAR